MKCLVSYIGQKYWPDWYWNITTCGCQQKHPENQYGICFKSSDSVLACVISVFYGALLGKHDFLAWGLTLKENPVLLRVVMLSNPLLCKRWTLLICVSFPSHTQCSLYPTAPVQTLLFPPHHVSHSDSVVSIWKNRLWIHRVPFTTCSELFRISAWT